MFLKEVVNIDEAVDYLNELFRIDTIAIRHLVNNRILCNTELANHPTCQVCRSAIDGRDRVGILGVINGMFGTSQNGRGTICANFDETGELQGFSRLG